MAIDWNKAKGSSESNKKKKSEIDWGKAGAYSKEELDLFSRYGKKTTTSKPTTNVPKNESYKPKQSSGVENKYSKIRPENKTDKSENKTDKSVQKQPYANANKRATGYVDMKADEHLASVGSKAESMTDSEREKFLAEYISKPNKDMSASDVVLKQNQAKSKKAWDEEKAEYKATRKQGATDKTTEYKDKFYDMSYEERKLIGLGDEESLDTLKSEYGYTDDDITAMTYFYNRHVNKKKARQEEINAKVNMEQHPFLESVASVPMGLAGGVGSLLGIADSYIDNRRVEKLGIEDQGLDYNHQLGSWQRQAQAGRQEFTDTHDLMIGDYDIGDMLYNTALSGLESATAAVIPGGAVLLGVNAGTSKANELARRGLSSEQAINGGIVAGVVEGLFEEISIGKIKKLQDVPVHTVKGLVTNIGKSMVTNFQEEAATELANIIYDSVAHGDKSEYQTEVNNLVASGEFTEKEAQKEALIGQVLQVIEAGASGALMGGVMGGVASGIAYETDYRNRKAIGQAIKESGHAEDVVKEARQSNEKAVQEWVKRINKTDKTTGQVNVKDADLGGAFRSLAESDKRETVETNTESVENKPLTSEERVEISNPTLESKDGKVVSVASVENVGNGEITVKDSDGTTRKLDVNKLEGTAKSLWNYASTHFKDAKAVESFVNSYEGGNVESYSRIYKGVFDLASVGMSAEKIVSENIFEHRVLGEKAFKSAVESGHTAMTYKAGVVDLTTEKKSNSQELTMKIADSFGKRHGMNIVFVDTLGNREGFLTQGKNQIVVALDASGGAISRTLGHETFHYVKIESSEQAKQITDFVVDTMTRLKGAEWVESRYEFYAGQGYESRDAQIEEFVADQMFEVFSSERAVKEFVAQDMNLAQKVISHIRDAIAEIKSIIKKLVSTGRYEDIKAWEEDVDALEKLNNMMLDALSDIEQRKNVTSQEQQFIDALGNELGEVETNYEGKVTLVTNEDESVVISSHVTWDNGGRADLEKALKRNGYNATEVADIVDSVEEIADFLENMAKDYAENKSYSVLQEHLVADITMDVKNGKAVLHSIVNNGDYPVNIDLALNCKKRVAYMRVMRDLINNGIFESVKYDGDAIAKVNEILRKNGFETACLGCFVESRRLQFQAWAETIVQEWNNAVDMVNKNAGYFGYAKVQKGASALTDEEIIQLDKDLSSAERNEQGNVKLKGRTIEGKMKNLVKMSKAMQKKISVSDLLTPEGLSNLRRENPDLFSLVKSRYGAASPKIVQDYNPYSGEMANLTFARVKDITHNSIKGSSTYIAEAEKALEKEKPIQPKKMNVTEFKNTQEYNEWNEKVQTLAMRNYLYDIGGARMQSFSDFMIENVFDYVQIVADLAANKFPMHTYTKEIVMMRLFGMSGMKMNGSLICHVDKNLDKKYAGLLPASEASKGNAVLVKTEEGDFAIGFDDYSRYNASKGTDDESYIQSIGYKDIIALQLDKRYSPYVGNIAIGVSDLHIKAMLDSDLFRMVIPYHASGMLPQFAKLVGVDKYNDYTDYQNTTVKQCYDINGKEVARFKKGKKPLAIDTSYPFNAELKRIGDPKIVAENYVKWCAEKHEVYDGKTFVGYATFSPKFSNSPYGTDFSTHPNYYKLLEDFDVYNSVTEEYAEQGSVNMVFPSADNRLSESELAEYRERLKSKGIFTEKEIDKYVAKANMTFEEIIKAELDNRSLYESTQSKKYEDTINEISDALLKNHARSGQITSYKDFRKVLTEGTDKQKREQKGKLPLKGTYDVPNRLQYSTKRESDIEAYWAETVRENHSFRNIITLLGEMEIASGKTQLDSKDINRIAKDIVKGAKSKYDVNQLSDQLTVIYDYMENGKNSDNDEIYIRLLDLANDVLNQTEFINSDLYNQYKDVREYIRNTPIYITPNVKAEIESQFGSFNTFRRMLMGKAMRLTTTDTSARTLDEVWKTLAEYDEGHFPSETNELDMPTKLVEFFDSIAPTVYSPYAEGELSLEDESVMLALDMYQQFYSNVKRLESVESKYKNLVYENMRELEKNKKALIQQFKKKSEENFEEYKNRLAEYKKQREQGDRRRVFRNEFNRSYNYVSRRLERETDRDHIPEKLKGVASAFVGMIPDSSQRFSESKLARFENEYRKLKDETTLYDDDMPQRISALAKRLTEDNGMPRMRDLDIYELEEIKNIANHIKYIIQSENELFSERIRGRVEDYAVDVHNELLNKRDSQYQGVPDKKYSGRSKDKAVNSMDAITKGLTKPEYLFSNLGSETLYNLYKELRRGENTEGRIIDSAKNFEVETKKKYKYDSRWDTKDITIDFGDRKLKITTAEAMSLYATSKRKQGLQHMLGGGVVIYAREEVKKNSEKTKDKLQRVKFVFREEDISKLHNALTKNQKDYADAMVEYITNDIGAERNKVSMILHGIEKYKESFYFPIKVDKNYIDANLGKQEVVSTIQNQSSAKRINKYANNPIEIKNFNEVINEHIYDSALYCAYALPVNDFRRVYNYKSREFVGEGAESLIPRDMSIQNDIRRANGINTVNQIKDFMVALDSGSRYENLPSFSAKMTSKMKKASTMASLSVVVQQPTAVFRAMLYINPKHFVTWATKKDVAEMKKYNGCALKKQVGYFDVNMGRTVTDYLNEYTPSKDVLKDYTAKELVSNGNIMMKVDQLASFGAEKADEMTWGAIWNACKKQVKSENSSLEGEALYQAAADLFQEVIAKTQVYDSVFTKPDYMRRKEGFAMMTTSFMSEPLTTLNMLVDSVANAKNDKESKVKCARAFGCFMTSLVVNNMLKALVYSMRDDDDDESYLEKYVSNVLGGMVDDVFGMFPYVRDIVSIIKGYDVTRMDTQAFSTLIDSIKVVLDEDKGGVDKVLAVLKSVGQLTGVPAYNIARDAKAIVKIAERIKDGIKNGFEPTTSKGVLYEIQETFEWIPGIPDAPKVAEQVIESYLDGDTAHYQKQKANMLEKYDGDATEVKKQLSRKLGDMYKEGKIDKKDATRIMRNTLGKNQKEIDKAFKNWEESKEKAENE